jgi:hypothetical protein
MGLCLRIKFAKNTVIKAKILYNDIHAVSNQELGKQGKNKAAGCFWPFRLLAQPQQAIADSYG